MKILLIAPYVNLNYERATNKMIREDFYPSAALLHLASILRANEYEPIIIDLNNAVVHSQNENYLEYSKKIIIDNLNKHKPDLVGLNCLFSGVFPDVLEFAKTIKQHSPDLKIAVGGIHATTFPKEILTNCDDIDFGLMACRDTIPDIEKIAEYIDAAMDGIKGGIFLQDLMQNKDNASL